MERWLGRELGGNFQRPALQTIVSALVEFETECHAEMSDSDRMQSSLVGSDIRLVRKVSEKLLACGHEQTNDPILQATMGRFLKRLFVVTPPESFPPFFPPLMEHLLGEEQNVWNCVGHQGTDDGDVGPRGPIPEEQTIQHPPKTKFRRFRWRSARPNDRWLVVCNDMSQATEFMNTVYGSTHPNWECRNASLAVAPLTDESSKDDWIKGPAAEVFDSTVDLKISPLHARHDHVAVLSDNISPDWWDWLMSGRFTKWPKYGNPTDVEPGREAVVLCHGDLGRLRRFRWT